jgi:hypothetical protein
VSGESGAVDLVHQPPVCFPGGGEFLLSFLGAAAQVEVFLLEVCVPKASSTSCDQAVFVDQATGVSLPSDVVPVEIDRFG